MTQSMLLSTVLYALIVLQLATKITAQWKSCFDDSCQIKNLEFPTKISATCNKGLSDCISTTYSILNGDPIIFKLEVHKSTVDRLDGIDVGKDAINVLYTCGPVITTNVNKHIYPTINETTIYLNGEEYCSWSININNSFPFELIDPPQYYISNRGYQIYYSFNQTVPVAAANYSQLPESVEPFVDGYQYKAVGSEKYLFIAREANKTTDFLLKVNGETPRLVAVNLKNDISLDIECQFKDKIITVYAKIGTVRNNLWNKIQDAKIDGDECHWSLPDLLDTLYGPIKPKETAYELQIIENDKFVYFDEENFRITTPYSASSSLTIAKSLLISVLLSMCFIL